MAEVEYLGGLPGREGAVPIAALVQGDTLRLKYGRLFGGWSSQLPLAAITSAELLTASDLLADALLPATIAARLDEPQERLLVIGIPLDHQPATIILRGPWATLSDLRQAILQGRMRAAKQWHS